MSCAHLTVPFEMAHFADETVTIEQMHICNV